MSIDVTNLLRDGAAYSIQMLLRALAIAFLVSSTAACGQQSDTAAARAAAIQVKHDCLKGVSSAPNAAFGHHLLALCDCAYDKISATPISRSDSNDMVNQKIQPIYQACLQEVGDTPNAEDYRATGLRPPPANAKPN